MANRNQVTNAQLKEDLQHLTQTIEEMVSATADDSRGNIKELRERAEKRLKETRARLEARGEQIYGDARETIDHQVDACDRYVRDNPWTSIGIGAGVGIVIGMLLGRR
ncbi:DUF883 family protein [Halomonas icarae]|uniref:DUF883 family protein n=1 Tax=Halomonas icarae TaxID=2691040 RepID=A0A7X4VWE3_9GAMM|nr:DUF883 family protein [Halomonas icarae]MDR5901135.1 DUF883 family protein [Halomonas icarae]NAW11412.1 DUF883 family protein [Halomonas icarae]